LFRVGEGRPHGPAGMSGSAEQFPHRAGAIASSTPMPVRSAMVMADADLDIGVRRMMPIAVSERSAGASKTPVWLRDLYSLIRPPTILPADDPCLR
jgi:hypothetical protein